MRPLNNDEINDICTNYFYNWAGKSLYYSIGYELLFKFGVRWAEAFNFNLYRDFDTELIRLDPLKGNNRRYLDKRDLLESSVSMIVSDSEYYAITPYRTALDYFYSQSNYIPAFYQNKECAFHLFRHNYFKNLYKEGYSIEEIVIKTGEVSKANISGYIDSIISTPD